ncbi:MAG: DMT family transporter [Candidatus Cloacimonadota bacterium]|nr:DMT family transporter [Candidatus Cloacimonadota bacterium]
MFQNNLGEFFALFTAFCWTVTAMSFESAGKKVGSLSVNLIRLIMAFVFLGIYSWITQGFFVPTKFSQHAWLWLSLSGVVGFAFGDLMLFEAFVQAGSRVSMLVMSLVPVFSAILGWFLLKEVLSFQEIAGMIVTISGISLVILKRNKRKLQLSHSYKGLLFALLGALGQSLGLVLSKFGMGSYNAFAATQIRVISGIVGFVIIFFIFKRWKNVHRALQNNSALRRIGLGAFFGPFLGVSFSLLAIQHTQTGVASTIIAIVPVLIIPPSIIIFKEKINVKEIIGAVIAVFGVSLLFL